jgi:hypothetical protein
MTLTELVTKYRDARLAFNACPDMLKSSQIPPESQQISDDFFGAREELFAMSVRLRFVPVAWELGDAARAWGAAHEQAQGCPRLVNEGNGDEAARRMRVLDDAEDAMLSRLS